MQIDPVPLADRIEMGLIHLAHRVHRGEVVDHLGLCGSEMRSTQCPVDDRLYWHRLLYERL